MKTLLLASVLLVWSMTASSQDPTIKVKKEKDGIILECPKTDMKVYKGSKEILDGKLLYEDDNTGEYMCKKQPDDDKDISYMYVKFRTCKNCIQLDSAAATGMAIGNLVATVMIGVAVYHIASQSRGTPAPVQQASDRRALIPNESNNESPYQPLNNRTRSNDVYSYARTG